MSALDKLTESQFNTVWTEAVGRNGYDKKMFQKTLIALKEQGLIIESNIETSEGKNDSDTEANDNKHGVNGWLSFKESKPEPGQLVNYRVKTDVKEGKLTVADLVFCDWDNYEWKPI